MANSFPGSGLAYADQFSVGTSGTQAASLYVCSSCVRSAVIENNYAQTNLHHNTLWLRQNNSSGCNYASIGFTIVNNGGDHHRVNIAATANDATAGGNLALYTRNNNGNDTLGLYINHAGNIGMGTCVPNTNLHIYTTGQPNVSCGLYATQILQTDSQANYQRIRFDRDSCAFWGIGVEGANCTNDLIISGLIGGKTSGTWSDNVFRIKNSTGYVGIGTSSPTMPLTFADALGGKILLNANSNNYSIGLAAGVVSVDASMKFTAGCSTPGDFTFYRGSTLSMIIACTGNVGIGTSSPRFSLDVAGGAMSNFYMSCCNATVDGAGPFDYGIVGTGDRAGALIVNDITGARYSIHAGSYNLTFKKSVRGTSTACAYCTVMQFIAGGDTVCNVNVSITNSLGIGTTSPSYKLHVNGTFYAAGSSQDYKQSICNYNTDSCMFMKLKPVTYQYKTEWCHLGKELKSGTQIGLIAEEVAETYPELAILVNEDDIKIVRNVDYEKLSIVLLSEVQKLRKELDELKTK